jgi:hypothetical protein
MPGRAQELETGQDPALLASVETLNDRLAKLPKPRLTNFLVSASLLACPVLVSLFLWYLGSGNWVRAFVTLLILAMGTKLLQLSTALDRSQVALALADYNREQIGTIVDGLHCGDPQIEAASQQLLKRMLPQINSEAGALLNSRQKNTLYAELDAFATRDPELSVAILEALPYFGDSEALLRVETLAERAAWAPGQRRVQRAAIHCLPLLRERVERQEWEQVHALSTPNPGQITNQEEKATPAEMSPAARLAAAKIKETLGVLEEERKRRQPGMRLGFLIANWLVIFPYCGIQTLSHLGQGDGLSALLWGLLTAGSTQMHRFTLTPKQTEAAEELAKSNDMSAVGPLVEALEWPDAQTKDIALTALTRLLPRMRASDANLLNDRQRQSLYNMLFMSKARRNPEFTLALLKALEQVGDGAAIPYVENLANASPSPLALRTFSTVERRIKKAAAACLPYLEARAGQVDASRQLLRAANAADVHTPAESLLRPATHLANADPSQLLRASAPETSGKPERT